MASAGSVTVDFDARSARFASELEKVRKDLAKVRESTSSLAKGFDQIRGAVIGVSFSAIAREALDFADAIKTASLQTGISIEQIQRLQFAAAQAGVGADSLTGAVGKLQRTLVAGAEGSATATAALGRLGIGTQQLLDLAPDKQFETIARAIGNIESPAERARAAFDLFGKSGQSLLPLLVEGSEGFAEINKQFDALGGPVSDAAINSVEAMGDQLGALGGNVKNLAVELLNLAGPIFGTALTAANEFVAGLRYLTGSGGEIQRLTRDMEILQEAKDGLPFYFNLGQFADQPFFMGPQALGDQIDRLRKRIGELQATAQKPIAMQFDFNAAAAAAAGTPGKAGKSGKGAAPALTPEELRIKADLEGPFGINAPSYEPQEIAYQEHLARMLKLTEGFGQQKLETESGWARAMVDLREQFGIQEINFEELKAATIEDVRTSVALSGLQIATALFGQNKKVALGVAAINIAVGATEALKLPFPANLAAVAKVLAQGAQLTASIRNASIGGGIGSPALTAGASSTPAAISQEDRQATGATSRGSVTVYINGVVTEKVLDELWDGFQTKFDSDVVLFGSNTRQAPEIRDYQ